MRRAGLLTSFFCRSAPRVPARDQASPELITALASMRQEAIESERARIGAILLLPEAEKLLKPAVALTLMGDISLDRARRILGALAQAQDVVASPAADAPAEQQPVALH